jgi:hypothetical protein
LIVGMCDMAVAQCEGVRPTRDWSYQPLGTAAPTLWTLPGADGELQVVAIGDSVVWGNGDKPGFKIVDLVGQQLADATHRPVHMTSWAHSGAHLIADPRGVKSPTGTDGTPLGDLNAAELSTTEQASCAAQAEPNAELLILDGCINDVSSLNIALPLPFNWTSKETVQRTAYAACGGPMGALLTSVKGYFPKATVIVLNYFQIVSEDSRFLLDQTVEGVNEAQAKISVEKLALAKGSSTKNVNALDKEQKKLLAEHHTTVSDSMRPEDLTIEPQAAAVPPQAPFQKWRDNSIAFLTTSQGCFTWAIAGVNSGSLAQRRYLPSCPVATLTIAPATSDARIYLAIVDNEPAYAYGAKLTHLWKLGEHDQMYEDRKAQCEAIYKKARDGEECEINPVAHPRPEGASAYAKSIVQLLKTAWGVAPPLPVAPIGPPASAPSQSITP